MSDNKKYYYLKLKDNFYESEEMVILQSMADGYIYSDILMKLYLKSLKSEGRLMFKDHIPYNPDMLATVVRHPVALVKEALKIFRELGLVDVLDNGAIFMLDIQNFIGKSSTEGDRKREYRKKIDLEKQNLLPVGQMSDNRPPEIEKELELESKRNIVEQSSTSPIPYTEIIDYLNQKTGKNFKSTSKATQKHIKARFSDGFTLEDFKWVIDIKCEEWLKDSKMSTYLRPETLFGTKFEGYLNAKQKTTPTGPYIDSVGSKVW